MTPSGSVIVVGAGVFGATTALELRRRGYAVTLCDPGPLPNPRAASTDISKFIRMDYGADEFYMNLVERALEGWDATSSPSRPFQERSEVRWSKTGQRSCTSDKNRPSLARE